MSTVTVLAAETDELTSFNLLGQFSFSKNNVPLKPFRTQKEAALLVYLAHTQQVHRRDTVAEMLWPSRSTKQALSNLRTVLTRLRKRIGDSLVVTRKTVGLAAGHPVDSVNLLHGLQTVKRIDSAETATQLDHLLATYHGDFLAHFLLDDAPIFHHWMIGTREHIRRQVNVAYEKLGVYALGQNDAHDAICAIEVVRRWLAVAPLNESAHTLLIRAHIACGQESDAAAQYQTVVELLEKNGIAPTADLNALGERIVWLNKTVTPHPIPQPIRHNLPTVYDQFVDRTDIQAMIHERLDQLYCRLVTIVGQGGAGKTRLSTHIARSRLEQYPDGVWFVELAEIDPADPNLPEAIAVEIATMLGLRLAGEEKPAKQLFNYLQQKRMLLVLDNFEHLLDGTQIVLDLMQRCETIQLIVTSREALGIRAEWMVDLAGLSYPMSDSDEQPSDAVSLFLVRQAQRKDGAIPVEHLMHIRHICRVVEGLPLAIELAAALTRYSDVRTIATDLDASFDALHTTLRDLPKRHHSLRVVFEMSWEALTADLQARLARLSVFRGDFDGMAAQKIASVHQSDIAVLRDKSLLAHDSVAGRWALHAVVQAFAAEKLTAIDDTNDTVQRHAHYYLNWLIALGERGWLSKMEMGQVTAEQDQITGAWHTAVAYNNISLLLSTHTLLLYYYLIRGLSDIGAPLFRQTITQLDERTDDDTKRLVAYLRLASIHFLLTEDKSYDATQRQCTLARTIAKEIGDAQLAARCDLSEAIVVIDHLDVAHQLLLSAHGYFQKEKLAVDEAEACLGLGIVMHQKVVLEEAIQWLDKGVSIARRIGHKPILEKCLWRLANVWLRRGEQKQAQTVAKEALDLSYELGDQLNRISILNLLGQTAMLAHQYSVAEQYLNEACMLIVHINMNWGTLFSFWFLGFTQLQMGLYAESEHSLEKALAISRELKLKRWEAAVLADLAYLYLLTGRAAELGYNTSQKAVALGRESGYDIAEIDGLLTLGKIQIELDEYALALKTFGEAMQIAQQSNMPPHQYTAQVGIAYAHLLLGNHDDAFATLQQPLRHYQQPITEIAKPFWVYLAMIHILSELGEEELAAAVLDVGYRALEAVARQIPESRRALFWENIATHKQLKAKKQTGLSA